MGNLSEQSCSEQCHCTLYRTHGILQPPGHNSVYVILVTLELPRWLFLVAATGQCSERQPGNTAPFLSCSCHLLSLSLSWFGRREAGFAYTSRCRRKNWLWTPAKRSLFQKSIQALEETILTERPHPEKLLAQQKFCMRRLGMGLE